MRVDCTAMSGDRAIGGSGESGFDGAMRLAVVCGKFPAFSETFISEMAARLVGLGHGVRVMASRRGRGVVHPEVERWGLMDLARYRPRRSELVRGGLSRVGRSVLRSPGSVSPWVFGAGALSLRGAFAAAPWVEEERAGGAFDAAVCHFGPNAALACRLRRAGAIDRRTAIVAIFHGIDAISISAGDLREVEREADGVYAVSHFLRDRVIERGMPADRIGVQRMGTDLARFPASEVSGLGPEGELRLVFVGRLIRYKACDVLIEAIGMLPEEVRGRVRLTVMGDGDMRGVLEARASALGLGGVVSFLGAVPQTEVLERLRDAHALVIPSVTIPGERFEGLGLVAAEAMSAGRAVIGSDDGGIPEMVIDGETGLRVRPGDAVSLAAAIERLSREPTLAAELGTGARAFMEGGEFDASVAIGVLDLRLRELVAARRERCGVGA